MLYLGITMPKTLFFENVLITRKSSVGVEKLQKVFSKHILEIQKKYFSPPKFTILLYCFRNNVITFGRKRPQGRHIAQIEAPDLVYQNHVTKSAASLEILDLKIRHQLQIPEKFRKNLNFPRMISYGPLSVFVVILREFRTFLINLRSNQ